MHVRDAGVSSVCLSSATQHLMGCSMCLAVPLLQHPLPTTCLNLTVPMLPIHPPLPPPPPPGYPYVGVAFTRGICGVSIIRSGEAMETALRWGGRGVWSVWGVCGFRVVWGGWDVWGVCVWCVACVWRVCGRGRAWEDGCPATWMAGGGGGGVGLHAGVYAEAATPRHQQRPSIPCALYVWCHALHPAAGVTHPAPDSVSRLLHVCGWCCRECCQGIKIGKILVHR